MSKVSLLFGVIHEWLKWKFSIRLKRSRKKRFWLIAKWFLCSDGRIFTAALVLSAFDPNDLHLLPKVKRERNYYILQVVLQTYRHKQNPEHTQPKVRQKDKLNF